jgi:disulfide bond formation protein DsbB
LLFAKKHAWFAWAAQMSDICSPFRPPAERFIRVMIRDDQIARLMGAGALALLLGALGFQYLAHLPPCEMCHWQRWPYIAAAIIGLIGASVWKWNTRPLVTAAIILVALLGVIITGQAQNVAAIAIAATALIALAFWKQGVRLVAVMTILLVAASGLVGAYQAGMQWGFLPGPSACTVAHAYVMGSGAPDPEISCNAVTWSLFGLSLAAYNAIFAFLIAGMGILLLRRNHAA